MYSEVMSEINCFVPITVGRQRIKHFTKTAGSVSGKFQTGIGECRS